MSLPLKIKGKRVAKARNIELLEVPLNLGTQGSSLKDKNYVTTQRNQ